jgi:hypothetical protein
MTTARTISELAAELVARGWPRVDVPEGADQVPASRIPAGGWWWCVDAANITVHAPTWACTIAVGENGQLVDCDLWRQPCGTDEPEALALLRRWPGIQPAEALAEALLADG